MMKNIVFIITSLGESIEM